MRMNGWDLGRIATLALAPVLVAPFAEFAEAQQAERKEAANAPAKKAPAKKAKKKATLSKEAAAKRYQEAQGLEKKGDEKGALRAYLAAGEAGHGLAQKRLGEIYDKGNSATRRDYETSLHWYEKARKQGIEVPAPANYGKAFPTRK
jgi:TPR repeat protein